MPSVDLKNPNVVRLILSVVLGAALLSLFLFSHFLPFNFPVRQEKIAALKSDFEKKSTELARARQSVADLPRFEAEYAQLHERWQLAQELLPIDRQMAALLRKITLAGQQTGVQFVLFKPSSIQQQEYYSTMPVQITVLGNYHQVGSFLAELANLRRIVTVADLRLEGNTKGDADYTTQAGMVASAYSLNTTPAPTKGAKTGSKT